MSDLLPENPPTPATAYAVTPTMEMSAALFNLVFGSIHARLVAREDLEADFEALIAEGTSAALTMIQQNVAPQLAELEADIQAALEEIAFITEGVAPNSLLLNSKPGSWYLDPANFTVSADIKGFLAAADSAAARSAIGVDAAIAGAIEDLLDGSPAALDTLKELATALGNDANFAATVTNALAGKVSLGGVGQQTMTRRTTFSGSTGGIAVEGWGGEQIEFVAKSAADVAYFTFHIPGIAAVNFGMGGDNQLRRGGKALGAQSYLMWDHGNVNVGAFAVPNAPTQAKHVTTKEYVDARISRQVFTSSGTWTKPAGLNPEALVIVELWGGGGGGGRGNNGGSAGHGGGGGGGGGYACQYFRAADLPSSVSVVVGAGGAAAAGTLTPGDPGGASSFGSLTAFGGGGGGGGNSPGGGGGGGGQLSAGGNGMSGTGSGGGSGGLPNLPTPVAAGASGAGVTGTDGFYFHGGGGGAGCINNGGAAAGNGGSSIYGGGGGGGGSHSAGAGFGGASVNGGNGGDALAGANASNGAIPGGGGGGAPRNAGTLAGSGARGECIVRVVG